MKQNIWLTKFPRMMLWVFLFLNILSAYLYTGSTYRNNELKGYSFTQNFLSDLGRTTTFSGEINFLSSQLFNLSLMLAGIVFIIFYFNLFKLFYNSFNIWLSIAGSLFGMLAALSLIGVGMTPADLYLSYHILFANYIFRFMFLSSILYAVLIARHPLINNKYIGGYILFTASILLYIIISEAGPSPKVSDFALFFQVVSQKLILIIFLISVYYQTIGIEKMYKE